MSTERELKTGRGKEYKDKRDENWRGERGKDMSMRRKGTLARRRESNRE
jgi:hypothetical protein